MEGQVTCRLHVKKDGRFQGCWNNFRNKVRSAAKGRFRRFLCVVTQAPATHTVHFINFCLSLLVIKVKKLCCYVVWFIFSCKEVTNSQTAEQDGWCINNIPLIALCGFFELRKSFWGLIQYLPRSKTLMACCPLPNYLRSNWTVC